MGRQRKKIHARLILLFALVELLLQAWLRRVRAAGTESVPVAPAVPGRRTPHTAARIPARSMCRASMLRALKSCALTVPTGRSSSVAISS